MTFNGHVLGDGTGYLASVTDQGNICHQMLSNYQFRNLGGEGYLRMLEFQRGRPHGEGHLLLAPARYLPREPDQSFDLLLELKNLAQARRRAETGSSPPAGRDRPRGRQGEPVNRDGGQSPFPALDAERGQRGLALKVRTRLGHPPPADPRPGAAGPAARCSAADVRDRRGPLAGHESQPPVPGSMADRSTIAARLPLSVAQNVKLGRTTGMDQRRGPVGRLLGGRRGGVGCGARDVPRVGFASVQPQLRFSSTL